MMHLLFRNDIVQIKRFTKTDSNPISCYICKYRYVESNSNHWHPAPVIVLRGMKDMNRLKYSVWFSHQMNHQDIDKIWMRRTLLVEEMIKIFRELDIEYRMLPAVTSISNWNTTFAMSEVHV